MRKQRTPRNAGNVIALRMWSLESAQQALPYFHSLQRAIRDVWMNFRQAETRLQRLRKQPGKPDRELLIALDDANRDHARIEKDLDDVSSEMVAQSLFCVDPMGGVSAVPFLYHQELSWFIVDMFDPRGITSWRRHSDSFEIRRPLDELETPPVAETPPAAAEGPATSDVPPHE
jgi:hypothetical protein